MLKIATTFKSEMDRLVAFVDLSIATFELGKPNLSRFRSTHSIALAARDVHARVRKIPLGLSIACEGAFLSACAQFEQGVRDLIEEAVIKSVAKKGRFGLLPEKMRREHTDGCGKILQNIGRDKFKHLTESAIVTALHSCVVTGSVPVPIVVEAFSANERNFKSKIISEHFGKLGVSK